MAKLARLRPSGTTPVKLYGKSVADATLIITNVTGVAALASVYLVDIDVDDATPIADEALVLQKSIPAKDWIELSTTGWLSLTSDQQIAVQTDTADALVFTLFDG